MEWLNKLFGKSKPISKIKSKDGERATEYDITFLKKGKCPNCETGDLYEGPSGGMSINYRCIECGQGFNIPSGFGSIIWEWVDNIGIDKDYIRK